MGLVRAASISPRQNRRAIRRANPITPFNMIEPNIACGTIVDALWISSAAK